MTPASPRSVLDPAAAPVRAAAERVIDAPPDAVWATLVAVRAWPSWNPDVSRVDGPDVLAPGTTFRWRSGGTPIASAVVEVDAPHRLVWTRRAPLGLRAVHGWTLTAEGGGTRVRTEETFDGRLARLFSGLLRRMLAGSLDRTLAALAAASTSADR